ncbi:MAG: DUF4398 domain-containing protein [Polyangiaceae bacterium]
MRPRHRLAILAFASAALSIGCAEGISPIDQLAAAQGAIQKAEQAGAEKEPQGQLHLKLAHEQLDKAKNFMAADDNEEAKRLLERAEADGKVARAYALRQQATEEAEEAEKKLNKLLDEAEVPAK